MEYFYRQCLHLFYTPLWPNVLKRNPFPGESRWSDDQAYLSVLEALETSFMDRQLGMRSQDFLRDWFHVMMGMSSAEKG